MLIIDPLVNRTAALARHVLRFAATEGRTTASINRFYFNELLSQCASLCLKKVICPTAKLPHRPWIDCLGDDLIQSDGKQMMVSLGRVWGYDATERQGEEGRCWMSYWSRIDWSDDWRHAKLMFRFWFDSFELENRLPAKPPDAEFTLVSDIDARFDGPRSEPALFEIEWHRRETIESNDEEDAEWVGACGAMLAMARKFGDHDAESESLFLLRHCIYNQFRSNYRLGRKAWTILQREDVIGEIDVTSERLRYVGYLLLKPNSSSRSEPIPPRNSIAKMPFDLTITFDDRCGFLVSWKLEEVQPYKS